MPAGQIVDRFVILHQSLIIGKIQTTPVMKRRKFLQNLSLSGSSLMIAPRLKGRYDQAGPGIPEYRYGYPGTIEDARNREGRIMVRLAFGCPENTRAGNHRGRIKVSGARINRMKEYFFEPGEDLAEPSRHEYDLNTASGNTDVLVLWLDDAGTDTRISVKSPGEDISFALKQLVEKPEFTHTSDDNLITANLLLDREIGGISPEETGIESRGDNFTFIVMADTQGGDTGDENDLRTRIKIHNAFLEESVALANRLQIDPAFTLVAGDICDGQGEKRNLAKMNGILSRLKTPVLYGVGNHETRYSMKSSPGYRMDGFNNYFAAQKAMNGLEKLLYSFNLGQWHFIVWPDPLRSGFWEAHPHYFDWLERDLEKHKDRPTVVFQHVPVHPVGINPLISYTESPYVKRTFVDILARHNNVRYVLSGHVHIPAKASFKTAVSYRGIRFINLPAAGYRPRSFGEADYFGGPTQGFAIAGIKGREIKLTYKTVTGEEYPYPDVLPEFRDGLYPLWFGNKWDLPAQDRVVNGNFENGLEGWGKRYMYEEDREPSNICEVRRSIRPESYASLYLYIRRRGYEAPGQDRMPQSLNRIFQAVRCRPGERPFIEFNYMLEGKNCDLNGLAGAYFWAEAWSGSVPHASITYSAHVMWVNFESVYGRNRSMRPVHFELSALPDTWHRVLINMAGDFNGLAEGKKFEERGIDRIILNLGVWNVNEGHEQPFAVYFDDVRTGYDPRDTTNIDGIPVKQKSNDRLWWRWKNVNRSHAAGEHYYRKLTGEQYPET